MSKNPNGFEIYPDNKGKWRWRKWMSGNIVSASTQGYSTKWNCERNAKKHGYKP